MVLESCMIVLDNSEYMRNGDYVPTRLESQHDAANLLVGAKTQSNPESTVGVIAMTGEIDDGGAGAASGGGAELLISPTDDMGKILSSLHGVPIRANSTSTSNDGSDITGAIQVASLALKHRRNKNGSQRVVCFVGSPLQNNTDTRTLSKCGRQLKKNNVAIDVICLGEIESNEPLLRELVDAANGSNGEEVTCHLVTIPPGVLPSDVLVTSPIVHPGGVPGGGAAAPAAGGAAPAAGGGAAFAEYGGVDPELDPELAMALRVSMEEERLRQERAAAAAATSAAAEGEGGEEGKTEEGTGGGGEAAPAAAAAAAAAEAEAGGGDEDALLRQALAMSMQEDHIAPSPATAAAAAAAPGGMDVDEVGGGGGGGDEDAEMQMALQMSMQTDSAAEAGGGGGEAAAAKEGESKEGGGGEGSGGAQFQDQQFVNQLLGSLPGVDPNDPAIQEALRNLQQGQGGEKKEGDEGEGGDKKKEEK